ncbi:Uncharacterized zinc protease y4wA [uncultured Gammaproteobacteria bacterium]
MNTMPVRVRKGAAAGVMTAAIVAGGLSAGMTMPAEAGVYFPETFTLANGMQVVVIPNHRVPVVSHMVWYKVGAADEPKGVGGIAHFLEHLMFKGTERVPGGEFSKIVARNGGKENAFTSWDFTAYFQTVAADRLPLVMELEADRMANLKLTDQVIASERDVVLEERRQRSENDPSDRLSEQVNATLFVHHPYGSPIIGWKAEIERLGRPEAEAHYRTWYAPNNAVLVVSGDIDAEHLKPLAEKFYGVIPARAVPARFRPLEPPPIAERRVTLRDDQVKQPVVQHQFQAPSYHRGDSVHAYPLQVLAEVMGGGATSRLNRALVVEGRVAASVWFSYSPTAYDLSSITLGATPIPGTGLDVVEAALETQLKALLKDGVSESEVAIARQRMLTEAAYARDSLHGPTYAFGMALATGGTVEDVESWLDRIATVTAEQVNLAARAVLGTPGSVTGLLLPADGQGE